jgi:predicted nucleic acid-binding protein
MERFVIDTNVLIRAIRGDEARRELAAWQRAMAPYIHQHAVVVAELLVGARDEATWRRWHERWVMPAERVRRVVVPGYSTWTRASRIIALLTEQKAISARSVRPGFLNDCLLAAGSAEHGYAIVTHDARGFELIARVEPSLRALAPFP